jgi:hypothetical protein
MPLYDFRMQELKAELQTPQNADLAAAGERGAQQAQVLARYTTFVAEIEKYFDWRDGKLQDSLAMLKEESSSPSGDAAQGKWSEYFARCASDGAKMVTDAPKDADVLAPELRRPQKTRPSFGALEPKARPPGRYATGHFTMAITSRYSDTTRVVPSLARL